MSVNNKEVLHTLSVVFLDILVKSLSSRRSIRLRAGLTSS